MSGRPVRVNTDPEPDGIAKTIKAQRAKSAKKKQAAGSGKPAKKAPKPKKAPGAKDAPAAKPKPKKRPLQETADAQIDEVGAPKQPKKSGPRPDGQGKPKQPPHKKGKPGNGKQPPKKRKKRKRPLSPKARKRRAIRNVVLVVVAVIALFYGIDALANNGKIHTGVTVGGVDVGGKTVEEAAELINTSFDSTVAQGDIIMYRDAESEGSQEEPVNITFDYEAVEAFNAEPPQGPVFSVNPSTIGAHIDGQGLAEQAYAVGRGSDFIFGRLRANTIGTPIDIEVKTDPKSVAALEDLLTSFMGQAMVNPNIAFVDGAFVVTPGNDGYMVKKEEFEGLLDQALLSSERGFVIPMGDVKMQVDEGAAQQAAQRAEEAIANPVTLAYGDATWQLDRNFLGQAISTNVTGALFGNDLTPYISIDKLAILIPMLEGVGDIGAPAQNVHFSYDGQTLTHTEAATGMGPNYGEIAGRLNRILFGDDRLAENAGETFDVVVDEAETQHDTAADDEARVVRMNLVTSYPTLTYDQAHEMGLDTHLIYAYTTEFDTSSENKVANIQLLSDILSNTVIMPGEVFSINETAGECNEEKGFKEAGAILNGSVTSEIGGGICAVATTVFNAAFESGYPIVERYNHSNYMASYPDGLDAAISWPYLDLRFQNDTQTPVLLLLDYTDSSVTCSLWGVDPGYRVTHEMTGWYEGMEYPERVEYDSSIASGLEYVSQYGYDGHSTVVERTTTDPEGNVLRVDHIYSNYKPKAKIIVKGTG